MRERQRFIIMDRVGHNMENQRPLDVEAKAPLPYFTFKKPGVEEVPQGKEFEFFRKAQVSQGMLDRVNIASYFVKKLGDIQVDPTSSLEQFEDFQGNVNIINGVLWRMGALFELDDKLARLKTGDPNDIKFRYSVNTLIETGIFDPERKAEVKEAMSRLSPGDLVGDLEYLRENIIDPDNEPNFSDVTEEIEDAGKKGVVELPMDLDLQRLEVAFINANHNMKTPLTAINHNLSQAISVIQRDGDKNALKNYCANLVRGVSQMEEKLREVPETLVLPKEISQENKEDNNAEYEDAIPKDISLIDLSMLVNERLSPFKDRIVDPSSLLFQIKGITDINAQKKVKVSKKAIKDLVDNIGDNWIKGQESRDTDFPERATEPHLLQVVFEDYLDKDGTSMQRIRFRDNGIGIQSTDILQYGFGVGKKGKWDKKRQLPSQGNGMGPCVERVKRETNGKGKVYGANEDEEGNLIYGDPLPMQKGKTVGASIFLELPLAA